MSDKPFLFHFQKMIQDTVFPVCIPVGFFIQTVDKSVVNIVGAELRKLPVNGFLDLFHIGRPSVFSGCVVGAEMNLIDHVLSVRFKCFAIVGKTSGRSGRQIDIVDSIFIRHLKGF